MKIRVLGCGNPLMADDGVGVEAVRRLAQCGVPPGVELIEAGTPGIGLLEMIDGVDKVVIIDAVVSGSAPGTVHRFTGDQLPAREMIPLSLHGFNLVDALEFGKKVQPEAFPREIVIIGVEAGDTATFGIGLSPAVERALPGVQDAVMGEIRDARIIDCRLDSGDRQRGSGAE